MTDAVPPALPAATVVVARAGADGHLEVLMVRRSGVGAFADMWVFPGGRVDDADGPGHDVLEAARRAAVREAAEEVGVRLAAASLIPWSHWTPPATSPRRYATWFFVGPWQGDEVRVDGHEIVDAEWLTPRAVLAGGLALAPPTIVTLHELREVRSLDGLRRTDPPRYVTRPARSADGRTALMWWGDAGYESGDADVAGPRHRLWYEPGRPWVFERD
jgi:8-oxo-dGTP pyrophosphatase MutT (NUDIX family)